MDKKQMLNYIYCLGFCADDMRLYLDTHYNDLDAIEYFNQCNELLINARKEYEIQFGELMISERMNKDKWSWNDGRMPWEGDC